MISQYQWNEAQDHGSIILSIISIWHHNLEYTLQWNTREQFIQYSVHMCNSISICCHAKTPGAPFTKMDLLKSQHG